MKNLKSWCLAFAAAMGVASGASASVLVSKPLNLKHLLLGITAQLLSN